MPRVSATLRLHPGSARGYGNRLLSPRFLPQAFVAGTAHGVGLESPTYSGGATVAAVPAGPFGGQAGGIMAIVNALFEQDAIGDLATAFRASQTRSVRPTWSARRPTVPPGSPEPVRAVRRVPGPGRSGERNAGSCALLHSFNILRKA